MSKSLSDAMSILEPNIVQVDPAELAEALRSHSHHTEIASVDVDGSPLSAINDFDFDEYEDEEDDGLSPASRTKGIVTALAEDRTYAGYWPYKFESKITTAGKKIVSMDPNLDRSTLARLLETEAGLIGKSELKRLKEEDKKKITEEEFHDNNETGFAHLSLCIRGHLTGCMAELVDEYSDDRGIPFALGAMYIHALIQTEGLKYIKFYPEHGYYELRWAPVEINVIPKSALPPHIRKRLADPVFDGPQETEYTLSPCPICGSPATMLKTGRANSKWHVCCTDKSNQCFLLLGLPHHESTSEYSAAKAWNSIQLQKTFPEEIDA